MGGVIEAGEDALAELSDRYGLEMQPETVPDLVERFGLQIGEPLSGGWTPPRALAREQHGGPLAAAAPLALLQPVGGERRRHLVGLLAQQPRRDQPLRHALEQPRDVEQQRAHEVRGHGRRPRRRLAAAG